MPMPEKKPKKVFFTEEDTAKLVERYEATTVLTLLQEVAQWPNPKFDWNELVKKTSTGISNAREYQMLWRHLAYHDALVDNLEEGAEPLDDDSDLDCEVEASPPVSAEAASEAAACVKVLIASHSLSESTPSSSTIEAPLTINVPVRHSSRTLDESSQSSNMIQGKNIIFPVTVPRQTLPTVSSTDGIETKGLGGGNLASKRKRITWSDEEDKQLRAAVQKFGEGNWATIAKEENFPVKKSPTQLSQRWSILRKKDGSTNSGPILPSTPYTTAEQLATRHSLSLALDMPFKKLTAHGMTDLARTSLTSSKSQVRHITAKAATVHSNVVPPQHPSQQSLLGSGGSGSSAKSDLVPEKLVSKGNSAPNPVIKAAAIAAGARIISPSDTVSQPKVAQIRHAGPTSSSLAKSSTSASLPSELKVQICTGSSATPVRPQLAVAITSPLSCSSTSSCSAKSSTSTSLPSESKVLVCSGSSVAYVRSQSISAITSPASCSSASTSLAKSSTSTSLPSEPEVPVFTGSSAAPVCSISVGAITAPASSFSTGKAASSTMKVSATTLSILLDQDKHVNSAVKDLQMKQEVKPTQEPTQKKIVRNDDKFDQEKATITKDQALPKNQVVCEDQGNIQNSNFTSSMEAAGNVDQGSHDLDQEKTKVSVDGVCGDQTMNEKDANLPGMVKD